jgi:hypothetical protein
MAIDRLLRPARTVVLIPLIDLDGVPTLVGPTGTTSPFANPAAALLEAWRAITTTSATGAAHGGNVSDALLDDLNLGLAASDTDTELTITSKGNEVSPTFRNVDATLTALRDADKADTGVFNLATQLLNAADSRYAILDRIGYAKAVPVAVGQVVSLYEVNTDNPIDVRADRSNLKIQQAPIPTGLVNPDFTLAA